MELDNFYQLNENNNMNGLLKLNLENVYSALVYGGLLSLVTVIIQHNSVFGLDWHGLVDSFVIGFLTSIVKNLLTTNSGNLLGIVPVIPDTNK